MIDRCLESLSTNFAVQTAHSSLLVELHCYCFFMVAEEACERCCKRLALEFRSVMLLGSVQDKIAYPFGSGGFA